MTNEEAISIITMFLANRPSEHEKDPETKTVVDMVAKACNVAISALEKQIEKPPVQVEDEDELCVRYECPACGLFLVQRRKNEKLRFMHWPRFCNCGQRLDWSAER